MLARFLFSIFIIFGSFFSYSAIVLKVKGNKCLVHLEGASANSGDYFEALDLYGNVSGIIRLRKIKNGKAIADIIEGSVGTNWILEQTNRRKLAKTKQPVKLNTKYVGILPTVNFNMAQKKSSNSDRIKRFYGFSGGGSTFFNFLLSPLWALDFQLGASYVKLIESSASQGQSNSGCKSTSCKVWMWWFPDAKISLQLRIPSNSNVQFWMGGGVGLSYWGRNDEYYEVIGESSFSAFQTSGHLFMGANVLIGNNLYLPISISFSQVQAFSQNFKKFFGSSNSSRNNNYPVSISNILFQVGLSKSI